MRGGNGKQKKNKLLSSGRKDTIFLTILKSSMMKGHLERHGEKKGKKTNMSINISRTRWLLAGSSKKFFFDVCHFSFFLPFFPFSFFVPLWWGWSSSCKNLVNAVKMVDCLYNILSDLVAKVKSQFLFLLSYSVNMCINFRYKIEMAIKLC